VSFSSPQTAFAHCSRLSPHPPWAPVDFCGIVLGEPEEAQRSEVCPPTPVHLGPLLRGFEERLHWPIATSFQKLEASRIWSSRSSIPHGRPAQQRTRSG